MKEEASIEKIVIGFVCSEKKTKRFMSPFCDYINEHQSQTHKIINLCEGNKPDTEWPVVDILLVKLTDELTSEDPGDQLILESVKRYVKRNPNVCQVEPFDKVTPLLDRVKMFKLFEKVTQCNTPSFEILSLSSPLPSIIYPLMIKTHAACGTSDSHEMHIFIYEDQYKSWRNKERSNIADKNHSFMAQRFINHDGFIYKCYVIQNHLWVQRRGSFENISFDKTIEPISFNSQDMKDLVKNIPDENLSIDNPIYKTCEKLMHELYNISNLDLFGFDVIFSSTNNEPFLVDMNYFPGYKGIKDRDSRIFNMLSHRYEVEKKKDSS